jgi:hypothetical protein
VTVLSTGFTTPESISLAPSSFGLPTGTLVVADAATNAGNIFSVPAGGGTPTSLLASPFTQGRFNGGVFAPSSFGSLSGDYIVFAQIEPSVGTTSGAIYALAPGSSTLTPVTSSSSVGEFYTPVLAPSGFGTVAGDILIPEINYPTASAAPTVDALSSNGSLTTFATLPGLSENGGFLGSVFAPAGFVPGASGTTLLVSEAAGGQIYSINSSGAATLFATVPLGANQTGLRQMAFAPAGFGAYGGDLFVSVSGSSNGGGTYGSVDVIDSAGNLVAILTQGTAAVPFDPRGLYFESSSQLLVADTDPYILSATPAAFSAVPEPGTFGLVAIALGLLPWLQGRVSRHRNVAGRRE